MMDGRNGFLRGAGEALLVPFFFAVVGLAGVELRAGADVSLPTRSQHPAQLQTESESEMEVERDVRVGPEDPASCLWLVDGFNVVSVGLLREQGQGSGRAGWWRRENREALVERARGFDDAAAEVWIVFDGADPGGNEEGATPRTVFARSADDWLLEQVRAADDPARLTVVTADRRLANRVRSRGAQVVSPGDFLGRCLA